MPVYPGALRVADHPGVIAWWLELKFRVRPLLWTCKRLDQLFWRSLERTGEMLHPRGETLTGDGSPDWTPHLLQHDQEHARPQRGALNLPRGPQVVADQQQQQRVAAHL